MCLRGTTNQQKLLNGHLTQRSKLIFSVVIKSQINPGAHFGSLNDSNFIDHPEVQRSIINMENI